MRHLLILAAAASLAMGCHSRTEDEVGAAPERDTTAVIDDTTAVIADTAQAFPTDTTMGQVETDTSFVQQDTTAAEPTGVDTVGAQGEVQTGDTTGAWTDTTGAAMPADTTAPADTAGQQY
jgi:hypothetical protein